MPPKPAVGRSPDSTRSLTPLDQHSSCWQCLAISALVSIVIFLLTAGLDYIGNRYPFLDKPRYVVDTIVSLVCGGLLFKAMHDAQRRYRALLHRLSLIADINHHVRNALEQIEFSAHATKDQQLRQNVHEAVMRIEWVLREVLPQEAKTES